MYCSTFLLKMLLKRSDNVVECSTLTFVNCQTSKREFNESKLLQKKEKTEKGSTKPLKINVIRLKILKSVVHKLLIDNYSNGFAEKLQQKWKLSKSEEL